ncbi:CheA signal transduction histidine kinase [Enterobacter sp. BIGb0383]|uniref:chemotaxis protein CheA n=1 Tax=unclassified Enterobacter TaxID=2608935 RepID=UPI000F49BEDA|nr:MULTISPECIES: chemotaxis protein CheA [unclassified Enterobacter]ROP58314.1 CheA signal transduction histidine kinase [Enterobacter sp. BIGb0383]ROS06798.1 CheA signal transduction histidine kinase [Enterobacter sp. BIGb0359]
MDISDFYQTFFDEADELLADMEKHLLDLDSLSPDKEQLNAIFRAAHSIKGGAGTFGFTVLQETTHILENLLDDARCGGLSLTSEIINIFLESKDIMQEQLDAYKSSQEPDSDSFKYICEVLRQIAVESQSVQTPTAAPALLQPEPTVAELMPITDDKGASSGTALSVTLLGIKEQDKGPLTEELANLGTITHQQQQGDRIEVTLNTDASADDIIAVMCFVLEPQQIVITAASGAEPAAGETFHPVPVVAAPAPVALEPEAARSKARAKSPQSESGSIRVVVDKVDQIINLVGELIITQAMLTQLSGRLDPSQHDALMSSISQLERNARDLQESVMSIRMMPMEYVFSRFPRLVHDLAGKLNKEVELTLRGGSAELDKSLIEKITDPLTHLVRNSLDHGIESVEERLAKGKPAKGNIILSAEHHGGNIVIEVIDDGAGLNREKILARARSQGLAVSDNISDEEVWMLIFAPGFSTAEKVTDVSGRGVGMDVVKRNIQEMGGYVVIRSEQNKGSTMRIVLPLTLAILDGMSVRVGEEIYVLPLGTVMESRLPTEKALYRMAGDEMMLQVREEYLPLIELRKVFDLPGEASAITENIAVIVQSAGCRYALLVDQLIGQHQVVVKNLELNYRKVPGISAATILGDGSVALILDVAVLATLAKEKRQTEKAD